MIMNDSKFLTEFYGPTLLWFGPIFCSMGLLAVFGNGLLLWIALSTSSIRSVRSNWLVMSLSFSDFLFGFTSAILCGNAFICGRNGSCPVLVKVCGALFISTVLTAMVLPTFILINRYLTVTKLPSDRGRIRKLLLTKTATLSIVIFIWSFVIVLSSVYGSFDALGEDYLGFYGAKPFTSFWLYITYMSAGFYSTSSYFFTNYFYGKLQKFVNSTMERSRGNNVTKQHQDKENNETKEVMKMVKLSTLIPLMTQWAGFTVNGAQWFMPEDLVPMWCRRIVLIMFAITPMCGPWLSMLVLGPFKRELKRRLALCFCRGQFENIVTPLNTVDATK